MPFLIPMVLGGPLLAVPLTVALVSGTAGFRRLLARMGRWRAGARWYLVAILAAPLVFGAVHGVLAAVSSAYLPNVVTSTDPATLVLIGILAGLVVGILEELGWTGIALPHLRNGYSATPRNGGENPGGKTRTNLPARKRAARLPKRNARRSSRC